MIDLGMLETYWGGAREADLVPDCIHPLEDSCWMSVENRSRKECHDIRLAHGIEATIRASRGR